ncbi:MAG TPA: hypothetical protein VGM78_13605 [Ilumatobacteraceae bacterium]
MAGFQTEYSFTLPKGFVDTDGSLHRDGVMRLATARDEIEPLRDQRVTGPDDPYLTILVLARVVTELGTLRQITAREVENLFAADLAFLQDLYGIINFGSPADVEALQRAATGPPEAAVAEPEPEEPEGLAVIEPSEEADRSARAASHRRRERIEEVARPNAS